MTTNPHSTATGNGSTDGRAELSLLAALAGLELPPPSAAERDSIRASIEAGGVLEAVVVSAGPACPGEVADGRMRIEICAELDLPCPKMERRFASQLDFQLYRFTVNLERRQLTIAQRIQLGMALEPQERLLAAARKAQAAGKARGEKTLPVELPQEKGETREHIARRVGLKASSYGRGSQVLRQGSAGLIADFQAGRETVNSAWRRLCAERRRAQITLLADELERQPPALPGERYPVLVVDPPWPYPQASLPYPTMTLDEIAALPIPQLLTEDGVVWLWTTNRFLFAAQTIACQHWQLDYRNLLTWAKQRVGTGRWLRGQTEHCLLLTRGQPPFRQANDSTLLGAEAREHSRKPNAFYQLVERTCAGAKLELFARERRAGWQSWGAETQHFPSAAQSDQDAA